MPYKISVMILSVYVSDTHTTKTESGPTSYTLS